jgi:formate dehydrogenase iron-sulfur subunit
MLVLTQASVGAACVSVLPALAEHRVTLLVAALGLALAGLGASVFHLGRPLGAWRGFLNVRRSWMSREIVVFGAYPALVSASMALPGLSAMAAATGLLGVCCSAIIYADTRRELWRARRTLPLFLLTTLISGAASALVLQPTHRWFVAALVVVTVLKLAVEISALRHVTDRALTPMRKTALLITGRFQPVAFARTVAVMLGGVGLPVLLSVNAFPAPHIGAIAAFALLIAGEFCERFLFFRCVVAPKMPGGMA